MKTAPDDKISKEIFVPFEIPVATDSVLYDTQCKHHLKLRTQKLKNTNTRWVNTDSDCLIQGEPMKTETNINS